LTRNSCTRSAAGRREIKLATGGTADWNGLEQAAKQGRLASVLERIDYDGRREEALIFWRALLTEDQLRAELRSTGKQALVGFALGVAAAGTIELVRRHSHDSRGQVGKSRLVP
jgi:hypothetical protein